MKQIYKVSQIARMLEIEPNQVSNILARQSFESPKSGYYYYDAVKFVAEKIKTRDYILKSQSQRKVRIEIVEVPVFITKEITYEIYESKINYLKLEEL